MHERTFSRSGGRQVKLTSLPGRVSTARPKGTYAFAACILRGWLVPRTPSKKQLAPIVPGPKQRETSPVGNRYFPAKSLAKSMKWFNSMGSVPLPRDRSRH